MVTTAVIFAGGSGTLVNRARKAQHTLLQIQLGNPNPNAYGERYSRNV